MAIYYISPSGIDTNNGSQASPWRTLYKATSVVKTSGDVIRVASGAYTETQKSSLASGVSIEGDGANTTIIKSSIQGDWNEFLSLSSSQNTNGNQSISGITINGQYSSESTKGTWVGIWISGRSNVLVHDMSIINFYASGAIFDGFDATSPMSDPGVTATGNKFYNNDVTNCSAIVESNFGTGCLMMGGQTGMIVDNNTIINTSRPNFKNGWPIKYWDNGYLKGCKITNNTLVKSPYLATYWGQGGDWDFCIELFNIQGLEIGNNRIQGAIDLNYNYKGSYDYSVWIHDNILDHASSNYTHPESGIIFEFATQTAIVENNTINNAFVGISYNARYPGNHGGYTYPCPSGGCSEISDNIIRNNVFSNLYQAPYGTSGGIIMQLENDTKNPYVKNMQIYNNTFVAKSTSAAPLGVDFTSQSLGNVTGVFIRNNIFQGFSSGSVRANTAQTQSNIVITHNDSYNTATPVWPGATISNNITSNPIFVSATDFHLQATSPLIGAGYDGTNIGAYSGSVNPPSNLPPKTNAGVDKMITLPTNTVTLVGSGTDSDGSIVSYTWNKVSGPMGDTIVNPNSSSTVINGLIEGTYLYKLTVTDNGGLTDFDQASVIVNPSTGSNKPPVVNAGADQTIILTATLTGTVTDDGLIASYKWAKVSGPTGVIITSPTSISTTVTGLKKGIYVFKLTATDDKGLSSSDTKTLTIE